MLYSRFPLTRSTSHPFLICFWSFNWTLWCQISDTQDLFFEHGGGTPFQYLISFYQLFFCVYSCVLCELKLEVLWFFSHYWLIEKKVGDFSNEPEQHSQRWMGLQLHWEMLKFKSFLTFSLSLFCGWHGSLVIAASSGKINASAFKKLRRLMDFQMHALDREKCLDHARCLFSLKWTMAIDGKKNEWLKKSFGKAFYISYIWIL